MQTPANADEHVLVEEVAARCHVKPPAVHDWIRSGKLKAVRPGKRYLIRRTDLEAFLARSVASQ